jgi:3-hydroxyacyl-[acyl-carrier-protein] dehydratase
LNQILHWTVPLNHPAFAGHFPNMPILPGVVLLDMAIHAMADAHLLDVAHYQISTVKFLSPAKPGEDLTIEHSQSSQSALSFCISAAERQIAIGKIIPALSTPSHR